jgi:periplasmic copper chaperone A
MPYLCVEVGESGMKKLLGAWALCALVSSVFAQTVAVKVDDAWVRATVAQQKSTGAFMRLTAVKEVELVAVTSPLAGVAEIHEMAMEKDVMKMRAVGRLALSPGKTVELKPGGYHLMLMDLKQPVQAGDTVPLTLVLEDAAQKRVTQEIKLPVRAMGGVSTDMPSHAHGDHKH